MEPHVVWVANGEFILLFVHHYLDTYGIFAAL